LVRLSSVGESTSEAAGAISDGLPVEQQPSTKPDYLRQRLQYTEDGKALLDQDEDAVMMEWERPLMKAHAHIMMENGQKRVLNVGFGMGIIDSALQELQPELHIIIEAHPDVYKRMLVDRWDQRPNVRLCFGRWQEVIPVLIAEKVEVDSIFYDTVRCLLRSFEILRD
jgi:type IV protein arginine methyltransferase